MSQPVVAVVNGSPPDPSSNPFAQVPPTLQSTQHKGKKPTYQPFHEVIG